MLSACLELCVVCLVVFVMFMVHVLCCVCLCACFDKCCVVFGLIGVRILYVWCIFGVFIV